MPRIRVCVCVCVCMCVRACAIHFTHVAACSLSTPHDGAHTWAVVRRWAPGSRALQLLLAFVQDMRAAM